MSSLPDFLHRRLLLVLILYNPLHALVSIKVGLSFQLYDHPAFFTLVLPSRRFARPSLQDYCSVIVLAVLLPRHAVLTCSVSRGRPLLPCSSFASFSLLFLLLLASFGTCLHNSSVSLVVAVRPQAVVLSAVFMPSSSSFRCAPERLGSGFVLGFCLLLMLSCRTWFRTLYGTQSRGRSSAYFVVRCFLPHLSVRIQRPAQGAVTVVADVLHRLEYSDYRLVPVVSRCVRIYR